MRVRKPNRPEPTVLADSVLEYTGIMPDDPSSPPASDTTPSVIPEIPNRPEPTVETPPSASESAGTQPQSTSSATESASVASEEPQAQPTPTADPSPSQQPEGEAVSQSTQPVSESATVPPAQENGTPETDQEKQENQEQQATTEPQSTPEPKAPQPQTAPSPPSTPSIPSLHYPFYGSNSVTFDFGAQPTEERVKKKYEEWGIVGHNGIDFGLKEGTEVLACDEGTVIQAGDNGDHGISVTIKHSWSISIYSHLQSFGVLVNDQVKKAQVIGSSGRTGFTTGPHLHFGIQPANPDTNNGYLGYINPTSYLTETSPLPQSPLPTDQSAVASAKAEASAQEGVSPPSPQSPQPVITEEEIQKQAVAMFDARLKENSIKGNQAKKAKRDEAIQKILSFAQEKKRITNEQVHDLLRISQSTSTDYLSDLVNRGMLKTEGKGKATVYFS